MTASTLPPIGVVIPCYRVRDSVLDVIARIGPEVVRIYCVDDACPDGSGTRIEEGCSDPRVSVLRNPVNRGVGGAVITGYRQALADDMAIVVKIDGDGQMRPELLPHFVRPLISGEADYAKGNRFYVLRGIRKMPAMRLFGNAVLSFMTKLSSGYWSIFDPTNGYTAIHRAALAQIVDERIAERYFFESDMLFRLNIARAVVADVPMSAEYNGETSSLKIKQVLFSFLGRNISNMAKRIFYNYFLRDFNVASVELAAGVVMLTGGMVFGAVTWIHNASLGVQTPAGTVMLAALPILAGLQLLLAFLNFDVQSVPRFPLQRIRDLRVTTLALGNRAPAETL